MSTIRLTNANDIENAALGTLDPSAVRSISVEALVDTGATSLAIPQDVADRLGLRVVGTRYVRMADGVKHSVPWVGNLRLEILGRIVDPKNRELRVNPESPDAPLLDLYGFVTGAATA